MRFFFNQIAQLKSDAQHNVFFTGPIRPDGAGVLSAMTGVDDKGFNYLPGIDRLMCAVKRVSRGFSGLCRLCLDVKLITFDR